MNIKRHLYFILTVLVLYYQTIYSVSADNLSTPDPNTLIFPNIIINEVSFKDSLNDWIELYIKDDMNLGRGSNIKGLKIFDDSVFFTITNDFIVHTNDFLVINFKSETENFSDSGNLITFNIKRSGLTATTEQVFLKNSANEFIDAVCWVNSTPTVTEITDFNELTNEEQWSANITSCISSEEVGNNNSISRKDLPDSNSKNDWEIVVSPTKGVTNKKITILTSTATPDPETTNGSPFSSNNISSEDDEAVNVDEESKNTCTLVIINEILPNPEGTDTGNEWIELYNPSEECIMDGWSIDDQEGGSKPFYIYNEKVVSRGFLLLPSWKTKISLNNSEDSVRLFDGDGKIKETVVYEDAKENYSYARKENNEFDWTPVLTPLSKNIIKTDEELSANDEKTTTAKAASKSTTAKTINNGDLSDTIFITEVFPNPKGTDKGNEWVEIYNDSEEIVNLGGWYIDLGEGSTKKYIFENIEINSQEYSVLSDTEMSLTLKNSDGELRLLDFEDKAVDSITYQSAAENSSYMKVKITGENGDEYEWKWTTNVTKGEENQTLYKYKGIISMLDEKTGSLELTLAEKNDKTEKISAKIIQGGDNPLFDELKNGAEVELILSKSETGDFILDDFNIINGPAETSQNNDSGLVYIILSSLPPAGLLGYYGIKKFGLIKIITS